MASSAAPRTRLVFESGCLLTFVSFVFAYGWLRLAPVEETTYLLLFIVPGSAAIVYFIVGVLVPNLIAPGRIRWPLTITLPAVYSAMIQLCAAFWVRGPNPIVKQEVFSRASHFWQRPEVVAGLAVCQIAAFLAWALLGSPRKSPGVD